MRSNTEAPWNFISLQYCYLILNRRLQVWVNSERIVALRVGGPIAAKSRYTEGWTATGPNAYIDSDVSAKYGDIDPFSEQALGLDCANFAIDRASVTSIESYPTKWGMSDVPYSGCLKVHSNARRPVELILLGEQDRELIRRKLLSGVN